MNKSEIISNLIQNYCIQNSSSDNILLTNLIQETINTVPRSQMLSDPLLIKLLEFLTRLINPKNILELGTYTGYSALAMAENLSVDARLITCEVDPDILNIAKKYFSQSPHKYKIIPHLGPAMETLRNLDPDLKFDLVYLDANKSEYPEYYKIILTKLNPNGIIIVDNTLQRGMVAHEFSEQDNISKKIFEFNKLVKKDPMVEVVLLPFGDGVSLILPKSDHSR